MIGKSVSLSLSLRSKEAGFRLAADAAENPLSFDVATAVVLRFAKPQQSYLVRLFALHGDS